MEPEQKPLQGLGEAPKMEEAVTHTLILPASPCSASPKIIAAVILPLAGCCQAALGNISHWGSKKLLWCCCSPSRECSPGPWSIAQLLGRQVS